MYAISWAHPNQASEDEKAAAARERELDRHLDPDRDVFYIGDPPYIHLANTKRQRAAILALAQQRDTGTGKLDAVTLHSVPRGADIERIIDPRNNSEFYGWLTV